jgi:hypothetical protein
VGADADGAVAVPDLDVEAQLAAVDDLPQAGVDGALRAVDRRGDVLDADLEADRGLAVGEVLGGEQAALRSIIAIMAGVDSTGALSCPPTSVSMRSSTMKVSERSLTTSTGRPRPRASAR